MTKRDRLVQHGKRGRKPKEHSTHRKPNRSLGGMPMKIKNGKITYAHPLRNPDKMWNRPWWLKDSEELERDDAELPEGEGNFIRRHIYEMRFDIWDETDKESC